MLKDLSWPKGQNYLLHRLPEADRAALEPHLKPVDLTEHMSLDQPDAPIRTVYFPITGIGSMIAHGNGSRRIEAGLFGREGMSGTALVAGVDRTPNETIVQVAGSGLALEAGRLVELMERSPTLRHHLLLFVHVLFVQATHTALANGQAKLEERLARWLLMCHDRVDGDEMRLTHEFLSIMLGVRRAGVTVGTHLLEGKGLIRAERGRITIRDREGLEEEAKGSYGVPEAEYARLLDGAA